MPLNVNFQESVDSDEEDVVEGSRSLSERQSEVYCSRGFESVQEEDSDASEGASAEDRKQSARQPQEKGLLESGAWLCVWILGFVVVVQLLTLFSSALKPLVLAGLFVWVLESIVQLLEFVQWKVFLIIYLLFQKAMLALYIIAMAIGECCAKMLDNICCFSYNASKYDVSERRRDLCNWERVFLPWRNMYAGKNAYLRFFAVVVTLGLLTLLIMTFAAMVVDDIMQLRDKLAEYEGQVVHIFQSSIDQLHRLPDEWTFLPNNTRAELNETIISFTSNFEGHAYAKQVSSTVQTFLGTVAASGGAFATEMTFFVLYTILWLFDPFHMDRSEEDEKSADDMYRVFAPLKKLSSNAAPREIPFSQQLSSITTRASGVGQSRPAMMTSRPRSGSVNRRGTMAAVMGKTMTTMLGPTIVPKKRPAPSTDDDLRQTHASLQSIASSSASLNMQDQLYNIMWATFYVRLLLNFVFGAIVFLLFSVLRIEFGLLIGTVSFFLLFIPQLGVIIASMLPIPVILLAPNQSLVDPNHPPPDGEAPPYNWPARQQLLIMAIGSMVLLRWLVLVQVERCILNRLVAGKPDLARHVSNLEVHPAIVLFFVVFAHNVWGTAGMVMTLPLIIIVRISMGSIEQDDDSDKED